jgi:hypothetical protein
LVPFLPLPEPCTFHLLELFFFFSLRVEVLVVIVLSLGSASTSLLFQFPFWVCFFRCEYLLFSLCKVGREEGGTTVFSSAFPFSLRMTCVNELVNHNLGAAQLPGFSMVQL